jgi:hypothetical protein
MTAPGSYPWSYRAIAVGKKSLFITASHDASGEAPYCFGLVWGGTEWAGGQLDGICCSVSMLRQPEPKTYHLSIDGQIFHFEDGKSRSAPIDPSPDGPAKIGNARELRNVSETGFVVGMGRFAYKSTSPGKWTRIDDGLRAKSSEDDVGLNSIHGFSPDDLYAVGFKGEIWHRAKTTWSKISSPTNVALNKVLCAPDGKVYACGMAGMLVSGRNKSWAEIEHGATQDTFWGMCWFKDHLYLSTPNAIFRLEGTELVKLAITPKGKKKIKIVPGLSFLLLDANDTVMWSVGPKQAMFTDDGETWTETPYA